MTTTRTGKKDIVFCGTVVHATDTCPLKVLENAALGVKDGKVVFLDSKDRLEELLGKHGLDAENVTHLKPRQWVMPGLVDCHIHSAQLPNQALGTGLSLLDWINIYPYPAEARFAEPNFARETHRSMVMRTLRGGTTSAGYLSTIHADASLFLCQAADELGQRVYVSKSNIDKGPDYYNEATEKSLADTKRFIKEVQSLKSDLVTPMVTPGFPLNCSEELIRELGKLAVSSNLGMQTHMSENLQEVDSVLELYPGHENYADVYDAMGLLGPRTILAHCIHVSDKELDLLVKRGCGVVHCPCSNIMLQSGLMDIRRLLDHGVKMGLGTDVGGAYTTSMLVSMRHSVEVSNIWAIRHQQQDHDKRKGGGDRQSAGPDGQSQDGVETTPYQPLTMDEAFRLATLGGSNVLGQNCGNFELGREFDALLIDPEVKDSPLDLFPFDTAKDVVHKFLYYGDDRNMVKVYVQGRKVVHKTA